MGAPTVEKVRKYIQDTGSLNTILAGEEFSDVMIQGSINEVPGMFEVVPPYVEGMDPYAIPDRIYLMGTLHALFEQKYLNLKRNIAELQENGLTIPASQNAALYKELRDDYESKFIQLLTPYKINQNIKLSIGY